MDIDARADDLVERLTATTEVVVVEEIFHDGFVDFYGYHAPSSGWFFCGWMMLSAALTPETEAAAIAYYERGVVRGTPAMAFFHRDDLAGRGTGVVIHLPGSSRALGHLTALEVSFKGGKIRLPATSDVLHFRDRDLAGKLRLTLAATQGPDRDRLMAVLARQGYSGQDTIAGLSDHLFMDFDEVIFCPPDGVVLLGWMLAKPGVVRSIRLHSGGGSMEMKLSDFIPVDRADVVDAVGRPYGLNNTACGFVAYASGAFMPHEQTYLEIETHALEVGYKNIPAPKLSGIAAMRRILDMFELRYVEVPPAFDKVVGPCIQSLNVDRLATRPKVDVIGFGSLNPSPKYTVIVPLYGRMDFLEYQMALFSLHPPMVEFDLIYVLDDPSARRRLESLAESVWERFRIPFRLVLLDRNMGFAPANNIGLSHAIGEYVCFLNSDVFPETLDWMERLVTRLEENPDVGCVGPLLLFEDGTIQHRAMEFAPLKLFGDWMFPMHPQKGWRLPAGDRGLQRCRAVTGAAMILSRALAQKLKGFDEVFVVGDFEDSDMCLKIEELGLTCAVDLDVSLFHLERKSQIGPEQRWRLNLTLYNAWQHQRRWQHRLTAQ